MRLTKCLVPAVLFTLLSGCVVIAKPSTANVHLQRELTIEVNDIVKLDIDAGAGELRIIGSDTASDISVKADIYTAKEGSNSFELSLDSDHTKAYLISKLNTSGFWVGNSPRIDLVVTLPKHLALDVTDGSGDLWIKNIDGSVELDDASGRATLANIGANLAIEDGSGALIVSDIEGMLVIDDASGDLNVTNINGDVTIEDGSGAMSVDNIGGQVSIVDASGDMTVNQVIGNVEIKDGSGELEVNNVNGTVDIDDASGNMLVKNITGKVTVNDGSGDIHVVKAGGLSIIEAGSGDLKVQQVKGEFEIGS
ncbi:hypothetical protein [Thalassotalea atypica]|uniref:hypothetical protein n=1 Tax=Thalassotalea atypica TaxID=2054316 RepID=UPI002572431F|nr:hypothetical protein [Thalassotalea atypica]